MKILLALLLIALFSVCGATTTYCNNCPGWPCQTNADCDTGGGCACSGSGTGPGVCVGGR